MMWLIWVDQARDESRWTPRSWWVRVRVSCYVTSRPRLILATPTAQATPTSVAIQEYKNIFSLTIRLLVILLKFQRLCLLSYCTTVRSYLQISLVSNRKCHFCTYPSSFTQHLEMLPLSQIDEQCSAVSSVNRGILTTSRDWSRAVTWPLFGNSLINRFAPYIFDSQTFFYQCLVFFVNSLSF